MAKQKNEDVKVDVVAEPKPLSWPKEKDEPKIIEVKQVTLGVSTINDHEQRITMLEAKIKELTK